MKNWWNTFLCAIYSRRLPWRETLPSEIDKFGEPFQRCSRDCAEWGWVKSRVDPQVQVWVYIGKRK